jgi:hypothetical protein
MTDERDEWRGKFGNVYGQLKRRATLNAGVKLKTENAQLKQRLGVSSGIMTGACA